PDEIAKKVKRSLSDVDYHLHLLTCGEELISMVRAGEVSPTTAVALSREHGPQAASVAIRQMDKARASGKSKLTRSAALPQFSAAKARQFLQIVADQADIELPADARAILDNYREFLKEAGWESEA
ncbi:DNA-binding protein, partial [Klebsiella pneumoniae]